MSIASAFQTGIGILGQIAGLRTALAAPVPVGDRFRAAAAEVADTRALPALPGAGFTTGGRFGDPRLFPTTTGAMGPPSGFHFAKDGSGRIVRNRHMNPLNASAARRAIRRIKGARRMLRSIESSLPKRAAPRATRKR